MDHDLKSIQEVRELVNIAKQAQLEFKHYSQEQVNKIVKAMADAGYAEAESLAKLAHEETGFGKWEDKLIKNQFGTRDIYNSIKDLKTVGVIDVQSNGKIVKIAEPMGVVAALIPSTNPTSTVMFKSIISLKCRNSIVASPHPRAVKCTMEAINVLSKAAEAAGAPKGLMQCISTPSMSATEELMKHKNIAVILATGSNPMVKAAYSAGTPAYGVGSGNVPAFIERTANVEKAVADIIFGTTFDYGTLCSSEQAMVVDRPVRQKVIDTAQRLGCYFVDENEKLKLEKAVKREKGINPDIVGKPAKFIADYAGFKVPDTTKVLIAHCSNVGHEEPLSMEKLSPVLAFYTVDGWLEGCHKCIELLEFGGIGHTLVIHSNDKEVIMKFALEKPAFRIVVNTPSSVGAVGYTTALIPSMTLGVGTWGGSIVSENVSAKHLMNIKTLAFETKPVNEGYALSVFDEKYSESKFRDKHSGFLEQIEERLLARAGNPPVNKGDNKSEVPGKNVFGSGISAAEIDKIIKEFKS
ncbi:MAG: aldehyde dehydrogenase family protein [Melioribacteraceae bacterium]|nr:aldehyde dehydrogenase family protein [Melioribacteraceae bacterium]